MFQTRAVDVYEIRGLFYEGHQFVLKEFDWNLIQIDFIADWSEPKLKSPPLAFSAELQ